MLLAARSGGAEHKGEITEEVAAITSIFELPLASHTLLCTVSIGVVVSGGGAGTENVLRDADIAMYRAKAEGRSQFVAFSFPSARCHHRLEK